MAMFRRSSKSSPPLRRREEEIARQEADLRERLEKLERLVAKVPQIEKTGRNKGQKIIEPINDSASRWRRMTSTKADVPGVLVRCAKSDETAKSFFSFFWWRLLESSSG